MKRRTPDLTTVPADLRTFDPARWIQDAIDQCDPYVDRHVRRLSFDELCADWYATDIIAPARYRLALWDAVGQPAGDRWYYSR